jgi:hypothetical protein
MLSSGMRHVQMPVRVRSCSVRRASLMSIPIMYSNWSWGTVRVFHRVHR